MTHNAVCLVPERAEQILFLHSNRHVRTIVKNRPTRKVLSKLSSPFYFSYDNKVNFSYNFIIVLVTMHFLNLAVIHNTGLLQAYHCYNTAVDAGYYFIGSKPE